jgi:hypothetical protein
MFRNVDPATKSFLGKEMYLVVTRPVRSPEIAKRLATISRTRSS